MNCVENQLTNQLWHVPPSSPDINIRHGDAGDAVASPTLKSAIIRAKNFNICAKYTAAFTRSEVVSIFQTQAK